MPGMVEPPSSVPLYVQLADTVAADIEAGTLKSGQAVPSEVHLIQTHNVSRGTVRAAFRLLRERELVHTMQGQGTFVRAQDHIG